MILLRNPFSFFYLICCFYVTYFNPVFAETVLVLNLLNVVFLISHMISLVLEFLAIYWPPSQDIILMMLKQFQVTNKNANIPYSYNVN